MTRIDDVRAIAEPIVASHGLEIYDVDQHGPVLRVTVTGIDGADGPGVDQLSSISKELSRTLDADDPVDGRYTLEVSSPGLERKLRTPEHFRRAVGETVSVKVRVAGQPAERLRGVLSAADDGGIEIAVDESDTESAEGTEPAEGTAAEDVPASERDHGHRRIEFDVIDSARTVFDWDMVASDSQGGSDSAARTRRSNR